MGVDIVQQIARGEARGIAHQYNLKDTRADNDAFEAGWEYRLLADEAAKAAAKDGSDEREITEAFERLAGAVLNNDVSAKQGHRYVERRSAQGKYVIFSDHHWSHSANRQNFFATSKNRELYCKVLEQYYAAEFTLVENGDVEELVIFEPTAAEFKRRTEMRQGDLEQHRLELRLKLLRKILDDAGNRELYSWLAKFSAADRLVRVAGNHDYDLQRQDFLDVLRTTIPGVDRPCDYLFLQKDSGQVDWVIMHGHQFDKASNPKLAPRVGETISEAMAWAYQGPDRIWRWIDEVDEWARGDKAFANNLVTDDYDESRGGFFDHISAGLGTLNSKDAWEAMFKHNVAWEYFEYDNAKDAIKKEVKTGDEWFKFRHLDEVFIRDKMQRYFPTSKRPKLLLGHSHEPRLYPAQPWKSITDQRESYRYYFNSGAAGRFANLIWGIEIVSGEPTLVSWCRADGPGAGAVQRREYENIDGGFAGNFLRAFDVSGLPASPIELLFFALD